MDETRLMKNSSIQPLPKRKRRVDITVLLMLIYGVA